MNPLAIVLIIIGVIIIIVSCRLVDKTPSTAVASVDKSFLIENSLTENDKKQIKNKMEELLADVSDEVIVRTDDSLSKLSNEKIMAVSEFSDQILEKINRNHEEVVFLYNMLNDKEKELKAAVKEIDSSKKKVQDIIENKSKTGNTHTGKENKPKAAAKPATQADSIEKTSKAELDSAATDLNVPMINGVGENNNSKILSLYSQGKSIVEISKLLDLGQGEVKLVIDLFKGKK